MPAFFRKKPLKPLDKPSGGAEPRKYLDLNDYEPSIELGSTGPVVRVGEVFRYEDLKDLTEYVYNGDILILDYTALADDELTMRRIINELKSVAKDVDGDVVAIGKNYLFITPSGIKIDRNKIRAK
ncbi:MAG: cell division protein SepF [Thermoplasmata archaeon]|nr:cell division protein SepF [Thermoplasmata archaeon]